MDMSGKNECEMRGESVALVDMESLAMVSCNIHCNLRNAAEGLGEES